MVGLWYAACGVGYIFNINIKYIIECEEEMTSHSLLFYSQEWDLILIMFLVLAKCYKLHLRSNEVNLYLIAEEDYERYMDHEVEYNNEMFHSLECANWHIPTSTHICTYYMYCIYLPFP